MNKPKRGVKRKAKSATSEVVKTMRKKVKKAAWKQWSPSLVLEALESRTHSNVRWGEPIQNEVNDATATSVPPS